MACGTTTMSSRLKMIWFGGIQKAYLYNSNQLKYNQSLEFETIVLVPLLM